MIKQSMGFNDITEKKYKILKTSLMLGSQEDKAELLHDFNDTVIKLDSINESVYEEGLAARMYTTLTLEEERDRLKDLISYIKKRVKEREELSNEYFKVTSDFLEDLGEIKETEKLDVYKTRLNNIIEYLNNLESISKLNTKLEELNVLLNEKYESRNNSNIINSKLENTLLEEFTKLINNDSYYSTLNYEDIDNELANFDIEKKDKKNTLDTFETSYEALKKAGVSGSEKSEYKSYLQDARNDYYLICDKMYMLNLYKLVLSTEEDYSKLYNKREIINRLILERNSLRRDLEIKEDGFLEEFVSLCVEQFNIIKSQKYNLEAIDNLLLEIGKLEDKIRELKEKNERKEIIELKEEFLIKENSDSISPTITIENDLNNVVVSNDDNLVIKVSNPTKMKVNDVYETARSVMKKVVLSLEPKKFTRKKSAYDLKEKRDKFRADKIENKKEDTVVVPASLNVVLPKEEVIDNKNINITLDLPVIEKSDDVTFSAVDPFLDDNNKEENKIDPFFQDSNIKDNSKVTFDNVDPFLDDNDMELTFDSVDPFLDDNDLEELEKGNSLRSNMPDINKIGSVSPTKFLSKIEELSYDSNDNVVLPTMGLTNNDSIKVPIVSENYISDNKNNSQN